MCCRYVWQVQTTDLMRIVLGTEDGNDTGLTAEQQLTAIRTSDTTCHLYTIRTSDTTCNLYSIRTSDNMSPVLNQRHNTSPVHNQDQRHNTSPVLNQDQRHNMSPVHNPDQRQHVTCTQSAAQHVTCTQSGPVTHVTCTQSGPVTQHVTCIHATAQTLHSLSSYTQANHRQHKGPLASPTIKVEYCLNLYLSAHCIKCNAPLTHTFNFH